MGLFDRFKKKEVEPERIIELEKINMNELSSWLAERMDIEHLQEISKKFYEDIISSFYELKELSERLEKAEFESGDNRYIAANMTKDTFVKKAVSVINSLNFSKTVEQSKISYRFIKDFHSKISRPLKEIHTLTPKQVILISTYFKTEARPAMNKLKELDDKIKDLNRFLDSEGKRMQIIDDVESKTNEYKKIVNMINSLEHKKTEKTNRISEIEKTDTETKISQMKQTEKWIEFETLEKEIKTNEEKSKDIEYNIKEQLSVLAKPLKKIDYLISKSLLDSFSEQKLLSDFLYRPFETFISEDNNSLKKLLDCLDNAVNDNKISIKEKDKQKIKDLNKAVDIQLKELKSIYFDVKEQIEKKRSKIENYRNLIEDKHGLDGQLNKEREETTQLKQEIKIINDEISVSNESISKMKNDIENSLLDEIGNVELITD
ncbi:MAG: hypothetical protein KKB03_00745 [Nanoarchaeota archaeon]|nr:hypothetical protein [Nanoarchaeota archaeon]MBU1135529.1 hypothetical protein [Nanoarchaeota archaeon]MBU2519757.1 hypothetical protein [Nanoarchaeota archaeon]